MAQTERIADRTPSRDARGQSRRSDHPTPDRAGPDHPLLQLQQTAGNSGVGHLVAAPAGGSPPTIQRHIAPGTANRGWDTAGKILTNALLVGNQGLELQAIGAKLQNLDRSLSMNSADVTVTTVEAEAYNGPLGGPTAPAGGNAASGSSTAAGSGGSASGGYTPSVDVAVEG